MRIVDIQRYKQENQSGGGRNLPPEKPINAPTEIRKGSESNAPSAAKAQPEYELSSVMTTGVSAAATDDVRIKPSTPASADTRRITFSSLMPKRNRLLPCDAVVRAVSSSELPARREVMTSLFGSWSGLEPVEERREVSTHLLALILFVIETYLIFR